MKLACCISMLLLAAALPAEAAPTDPDALKLGLKPGERRLIRTSGREPARWMSAKEILALYATHQGFMDITDTQDLDGLAGQLDVAAPTIPTEVKYPEIVRPIIARGSTQPMRAALEKLTSFTTRYYKSSTGKESADWLFGHVSELAKTAATGIRVSVRQFDHAPKWEQRSIIARIEGAPGNEETVIVGAHQDSIAMFNPMNGRSPGADDDGSGTVTALEAFRMILAAGFQPKRPVEFHWYAAEEAGLLGSQAIAQAYARDKRVVAGMMQLDMTMYTAKSNPKDIGFVTDYTNSKLTEFTMKLATAYTGLPVKGFACGYGCSDHASWNRAGYAAVTPFESSNMRANNLIHTASDTINTLDFEHGLQIAKLAAAYVVEMSHA